MVEKIQFSSNKVTDCAVTAELTKLICLNCSSIIVDLPLQKVNSIMGDTSSSLHTLSWCLLY